MDYVYGYFISVIVHINLFIYEGIKNLYNLMLYIAESQIISNEMISSFSIRIYVLLGIFMLFKLSFSLVTYVINPDEFFDKTKGITSIGKNIIISLVLIVLTPYLFHEARVLQTNMLNEHVIENLVFGSSKDSYTTMNEAGKVIQFQLFAQWIRPNEEIKNLKDCGNLFTYEDNGDYKTDIRTEDGVSYRYYVLDKTCLNNLETEFKNSKNGDSTAFSSYQNGLEEQNVAYFYNEGIFTARTKSDKKNIIAYDSLFSIISGIIVVFILISFCFDIAVRAIKLGFFQIMAPIPIISLCDPKGKDGMFKKWGSAVVKTYLSLFVRLLAINFSISVMQQVLKDPKWHQIESVTDGFATAFIIIGALMFAKQLPGILSEITGIKFDSKLTLNPFKKIEDEALGGKRIGGFIPGAVGGAVAGFFGNRGLRKLSGLTGGLVRGAFADGGYRAGMQKQAEANRKMRDARIRGAGFWGSRFATLSNRYGADDMYLEEAATKLRKDKRAVELVRRNIDSEKTAAENRKKQIERKIAPMQAVISRQKETREIITDMEKTTADFIKGGKLGKYSDYFEKLQGQAKTLEQYKDGDNFSGTLYGTKNNQPIVVGGKATQEIADRNGNVLYTIGQQVVVDSEFRGLVGGFAERYANKEGRKAAMGEILVANDHTKTSLSKDDYATFKSKQDSYAESVRLLNDEIQNYNDDETTEIEMKKYDTNLIGKDADKAFDNVHEQSGIFERAMIDENKEIHESKNAIEKIEREIKAIIEDAEVEAMGMKLEDAENDIKVREAELKDRQEQGKLNREMAQMREYFNYKK